MLCATVHQQPHICRESPFTHTCLYMIRSHLIYQLFKISTQCLLQWKSNNGCINLYSLAYIYLQISEGIIPGHLSLRFTKELMDLSLITSCNNRWITQSYVLTACQRRPTYMYMCCIQYRNWGQSFDISCIFLVTLHSTLATFFFRTVCYQNGRVSLFILWNCGLMWPTEADSYCFAGLRNGLRRDAWFIEIYVSRYCRF